MDKFDEIFIDKVKEVFDNHEEIYRPDDWQKLQEKMPEERKNLVFFMSYIAKAAAVIIFITLSVFVANKYNDESNLAITESTQSDFSNNVNNHLQESINKDFDQEELNNDKLKTKTALYNKNTKQYVANNINKSVETNVLSEIISLHKTNSLSETNTPAKEIYYEQLYSDSTTIAQINNNETKFGNIKEEFIIYSEKIHQMDKHIDKEKKMLAMSLDANPEEKDKDKNRIGFGVEVASLSNYSTAGTGDGINFGAGLSASYTLSKKLKFSTGMLIAKQSLNNFESVEMDQVMCDDICNLGGHYENKNSTDINNEKRNLSLITVDIPLNLSYQFNKFIFTTGVSSLLCLNETQKNEYDVTVNNEIYNSKTKLYENVSNSTTISQKEKVISNHFDFAKIINLSVGYGINLQKGSIVVEPYVKLPIGTVSSQNVFMGAGGLALRYNFSKQ